MFFKWLKDQFCEWRIVHDNRFEVQRNEGGFVGWQTKAIFSELQEAKDWIDSQKAYESRIWSDIRQREKKRRKKTVYY